VVSRAADSFQSFLTELTADFPPAFQHAARLIKSYVIDRESVAHGEFPPRLLAPVTLETIARPRWPRSPHPRKRADVLTVLSPDREDYRELFVPVLEELQSRQVEVSAVVPPLTTTASSHLAGVEVFSYQAFAGFGAYRRARAHFGRLGPSVAAFEDRYSLTPQQRSRLSVLLQAYCWNAELFWETLEFVRPRALLGIHVVSEPGLLGGLDLYRARGNRVPLILMQHGYFSHMWESHDFHGADHVLLWGTESRVELEKFPGDPPASTVVGNTKLSTILAQRVDTSHIPSRPAVLVIGTNGDIERERRFLRIAATALRTLHDVEVLYRPHPAQPLSLYAELIEEGLVEPGQIGRDRSLHSSISAATLVIGTDSTALLESVVLGVPIVQVVDDNPSEWGRRGVLTASDAPSLERITRKLLEDPARRSAAVESSVSVAHGTIGDPNGAAGRAVDAIELLALSDHPRRGAGLGWEGRSTASVKPPRVTIMIPTYGQERVLGRAIESALAQDYENLEVLVVDDASPDATFRTVAEYAGDPRFRYLRHERNLGRVGTYRDTLQHEARGDFVLNLDGDDWLHDPTFVSSAMRLVGDNPDLALVFARILTFDEDANAYGESLLNHGSPTIMDGLDVALGYADSTAGVPHLAAIYDRRKAIETGFYEADIIGSDSLSFLKLLTRNRVGFMDRPVAVWRQHGANASLQAPVSQLLANFMVADEPARLMVESGILSTEAAAAWRREVSVNLAYPQLVNLLAGRRLLAGVAFMLRMAVDRPVSALQTVLRVAGTLKRKSVEKCRVRGVTSS
jgi:hypothetical protein